MEKSYLISSNKVKMKDTSEEYKRKQRHQQKQKRFPETPGEHIQIKKQLSLMNKPFENCDLHILLVY